MNNRLLITNNTKIYVACPANFATGGPELLHQLVYELNKLGLKAYMYYYNRKNLDPVHDEYKIYNNIYLDHIEDKKDNILVVPEVYTQFIYKYTYIQKVIWWLSFDNYFHFLNSRIYLIKTIKKFLYILRLFPKDKIYRFKKKDNIFHFVQSVYAKEMLKTKGINQCFYLSDYINDIFFKKQKENNNMKQDIVVFNPKKGYAFTQKIIKKSDNIEYIPIENMKRDQIVDLLLKAKVYIDFGNHPGKDRLPREAVVSGCCVITSKNGSAKFYDDVPIDDEFKFDVKAKNIPKIIEKIKYCLENYNEVINKFEKYRKIVEKEKEIFISNIKEIFQLPS